MDTDKKKPVKRKTWRCFHCDEVFTREAAAREHFGTSICAPALCQVTRKDYDELTHRLGRYQEEDTDLHRRIRQLECEHAQALRRANETGYSQGLSDARREI